MANKLYIDKTCKICLSYGKYINSNKSVKINILDINDLRERSTGNDQIIFESKENHYYGIEGIIESMQISKKNPIVVKLLKFIPKILINSAYKLISRNRHKISRLLTIIKPKP